MLNLPDGTHALEIEFHDHVLEHLRCRLHQVAGAGVVAVFTVTDHNCRRLLEAESGRLRAQLERRGIRVQGIEVCVDTEEST